MRRAGTVLAFIGVLFLATMAKRASRNDKKTVIFQWRDILPCPELERQNLTVTLYNSRSGNVYVDTEWNVLERAKKITLVRMIVSSCRDDGSNCEHYMTWDMPMEGCAFISTKNAFWSPGFKNIQPPYACPLETGRYVNKNWTIDKDLLLLLPFPGRRVYKDRLEMWNEKKQLVHCHVFEATWKTVKKRGDD